jgi:hypothetical protein
VLSDEAGGAWAGIGQPLDDDAIAPFTAALARPEVNANYRGVRRATIVSWPSTTTGASVTVASRIEAPRSTRALRRLTPQPHLPYGAAESGESDRSGCEGSPSPSRSLRGEA